MLYCVSGRQPKSVLKRADEAKFKYKDCERIMDYLEELKDLKYIIVISAEDVPNINWTLLEMYNNKIDLTLGLHGLYDEVLNMCKSLNIKYYWDIPIKTWHELDALINMGPAYIHVSGQLYFQLDKVAAKAAIPIRITANNAAEIDQLPRENGICGTWVRPEDAASVYGDYVTAMEFSDMELSKEETLLHVYKEKGEWPGNLNLLLKGLNYNIDNRTVPEDLGQLRVRCGLRCMISGSCKACINAFMFGDAVRKEHYKRLRNRGEE